MNTNNTDPEKLLKLATKECCKMIKDVGRPEEVINFYSKKHNICKKTLQWSVIEQLNKNKIRGRENRDKSI